MLSLISFLVAIVSNAAIATDMPWSYEGASGPERWGDHFWICSKGRNQSPVNITRSRTVDISEMVIDERSTVADKPTEFLSIDFDYKSVPVKVLTTGTRYRLSIRKEVTSPTRRATYRQERRCGRS